MAPFWCFILFRSDTMSENWKNIIAGGDGSFSAYQEAIIEGLIDPKEVSHARFKVHVVGDYNVDKGIFEERIKSALSVSTLMREDRL
jgi:hypothetical protein